MPLAVAQVVEVGVDQLLGSHPVGNAYNIAQVLFLPAFPHFEWVGECVRARDDALVLLRLIAGTVLALAHR